jgi:hypothetical protein
MHCPILTKENSEILLDYCARKLTPEMTAAFENHMESCADCRAFSDAQKSVWEALDGWQPMSISQDFDTKLYARIEQHENSGWWTRLWHRGIWQPRSFGPAMPVATACVTLALGVMLYLPGNKPSVDHQAPQTKMENSDLDQLEITLEDIEMFKQLTPPSRSNS